MANSFVMVRVQAELNSIHLKTLSDLRTELSALPSCISLPNGITFVTLQQMISKSN